MEGDQEKKRVVVVVLGDVGRSPRMQFHCLSLAKHGFLVDLIGYGGSKPHNNILENPHIFQYLMSDVPDVGGYIPRILNFMLKVIWRSLVLFYALFSVKRPNYVLIQNPPCIPTFPVIWFYCKFSGSKLVIDWHNYSYTILSLNLSPTNILVKVTKWCEFKFGSKAQANLCVTKAMKNDLQARRNILATVLYDRPPDIFQSISDSEKHNLYKKLALSYPSFKVRSPIADDSDETRFSIQHHDGTITLKDLRPALIVSSTSYTEDEDFSILLDALEMYEQEVETLRAPELPKLVCTITGKGPLKEYYSNIIATKHFKHVEIIMPWLSAEDYPLLLASSDLGVCLHTSSSGLDLPMKVVDMFGCGLPVCAINYNCLGELVKHEENGLLFKDSHELFSKIKSLLQNFPHGSTTLHEYRRNLASFQEFRWDQCWDHNALPIFQHDQDLSQ